jgi:hypothetical protein
VASTPDLIKTAVHRFVQEVPALAPLKLVFQLELRGRGDVQLYRVQMPGPEIKKGVADEARITISMPRSHFNELAADGKLKQYREAYETGHIKATGEAGVLKLVGQVIERHEQRARLKKVH